MSNLGCRVSDVGCRMSNRGCRMSDVGSQMSDVGSRLSDVGCRMAPISFRISVISMPLKKVKQRGEGGGGGKGSGVLLATRFGTEKRCCHNIKSDSDRERIIFKKNKFVYLAIVFSFSTKIVRQNEKASDSCCIRVTILIIRWVSDLGDTIFLKDGGTCLRLYHCVA